MIISNKLKIIYIRLRKVASTSFESALSEYCESDYIETRRIKSGKVILGKGYQKDKLVKGTHITAKSLKASIPEHVWNNYLKIATIRCPYDMYISEYYFLKKFLKKGEEQTFEQFVASNSRALQRLHGLHDAKGKMLIDFVIRFEHMDEDIAKLERKIGCIGLLETFQKANKRRDIRPQKETSSYEMYSKHPNAKLVIDEKCKKYADSNEEFFLTCWPQYKTRLEDAISQYGNKP